MLHSSHLMSQIKSLPHLLDIKKVPINPAIVISSPISSTLGWLD